MDRGAESTTYPDMEDWCIVDYKVGIRTYSQCICLCFIHQTLASTITNVNRLKYLSMTGSHPTLLPITFTKLVQFCKLRAPEV